jgi:hypothetical protein
MNQYLKDEGDLRRYYSQIPHLADDELDPYEMRLYVHYKRVCGQGGECVEITETTATKTKMSERKVRTTRQALADKGWLHLEKTGPRGHERVHITLIDRWDDNYVRYSNQTSRTPAPGAALDIGPLHQVHPVPLHQVQPKEEPVIQEKPIKEKKTPANGTRVPSPHQAIVDVYVKELSYTPQNMGRECKAAKWLSKNGYTPDQVAACYRRLKRDKFWRDKFVSLQKVADEITDFARNVPVPAAAYKPPTQAEIDAARSAPTLEF